MDASSQRDLFEAFAFLCISLGFAFMTYFYLSKNASLKRRVWRWFALGFGVFFFVGLWLTAPHVPWFVYPIILVAMLLNFWGMKFCDSCGRTAHSTNPFSPPKFCSKCGGRVA